VSPLQLCVDVVVEIHSVPAKPLCCGGNAATATGREARRVRNERTSPGPFIGVGGMTVAAFLYGYTAIAFPSWLHSLVMPLLWLVLFVTSCAWFTRRPRAVVLLPVVAGLLWFVLLLASA
jgi:hypothetical protein